MLLHARCALINGELGKYTGWSPTDSSLEQAVGLALVKKGQLDEGIEQFQKALEINANYAEAHNNLGSSFFQTRTFSDIETVCRHYS